MRNSIFVITGSNIPDVLPGSCPVISAPLANRVLVLLPSGSSCTVDLDTMQHTGPHGHYIQFTTPEAIALAEYNRIYGVN